MLPKNNRNIFPEQNINCQTSTQNGNQPFRPPVSVSGNPFLYNPNLVVTQQQQPTRINNSFQLNPSNSSSASTLSQIEVVKRIAAAMQQSPTHPIHLINRQSQSSIPIIPTPLQVNQNSQLGAQMIRIPTSSQDSAASSICQALYLIQQNLIFQNDKSKQSNNHVSDVCKPTVSNQPLTILNNSTNSLSAITISSSPVASQSQNATVLTDVQILEAFNRLNSQQNSKPINSTPVNSNLSLIQSDSNVAQQLISALQKQSPRTSSGVNSQGYMLIGQTTKSTQINLNNNNIKSTVSFSPAPSNMNLSTNNDISNPLLKVPLNSKVTEIPLLTKLLDKLSYNPDNLAEIKRQYKLREMEENQTQRNINSKLLSSKEVRQVNENTKYTHNDSVQRSIELLIANNSSKLNSQLVKPHNNIDTHQILRDSKEISYLMPNSTSNTVINNDDMINHHFNKSLRNKLDVKKSTDIDNSFNYKNFLTSHHNSDEMLTKTINNISHKNTNKNKFCCSFIDLERPESQGDNGICENPSLNLSTTSMITKPTISNFHNQNNKLSIKETADQMVENLLKRSLNNCPTNKQQTKQTHVSNTAQAKEIIGNSNSMNNSKILLSSSSSSSIIPAVDCGKLISNSNETVDNGGQPSGIQVEYNFYKDKMTKSRLNPSKHDLPLKKRIIWDFSENCSDSNADCEIVNSVNIKIEPNFEVKMENQKIDSIEELNEKQNKIRRKRIHNDSFNESSIIDPNLPIVKKRRGRMPGTGKKQKMKEECRLREMAKMNLAGTEESWHELTLAINKPPDIDKISAKTLCVLDLEPLKISKVPFFQIGSCSEIAPRMVKCRSCRQNNFSNNNDQSVNTADDVSSVKSGSKDSSTTNVVSSFCRFHGFRKLQFSSKGTLTQAGFCRSYEADSQDLSLWRMYYPLNSDLSISTASYIIESLSEIFCQIIENENQFVKDCYESFDDPEIKLLSRKKQFVLNGSKYSNKSEFNELVWKRPVQGVREMCDVCDTSIFNTHWACRKCGYSVCVDCVNERQDKSTPQEVKEKVIEITPKTNNSTTPFERNKNNAVHQNTRGASRNRLYSTDHVWAVCTANRQPHFPDQLLKVELIPIKVISELRNRMHTVAKMFNLKLRCNCLSKAKAEQSPKLSKQISSDSLPIIESSSMSCENDLHLLADLALKEVVNGENKNSTQTELNEKIKSNCSSLRPPPVLSPPHHPENVQYANSQNSELTSSKQSDSNSNTLYSWIYVASNFKMIRLHNAQNPDNIKIFQQELLLAHPVIVSGCHKSMDLTLWTPEKFLEEFELEPATLVDCETGFPVPKGTMKAFWEGFECVGKRIPSTHGSKPACLKLKDWPPSDDFNDVLPQRCKDILNNLPIKSYTGRQGELNLAGHLPEFFVRPDLGPKLYNAYGMPRESKLGTTNLHLDIADAVNVMLYVSIPKDRMEIEIENVLVSMKEALVDESVIKRAETEIPGALWHIFLPKDVAKLRQFLYDVITEQGEIIDSNQDPIHDQQFYLDQSMLNRLKREYNVEGCAIVQFRGDAIFIPAGSPHQVRNLHSCMKVANDFVSPENILHCLQVTKEFRKLSPTHANHEDKLQAKNMIFHTMKDAVATLIKKNSQYSPEILPKHLYSSNRKRKISQMEDEKSSSCQPTSVKAEPYKCQSNLSMPNNNNNDPKESLTILDNGK